MDTEELPDLIFYGYGIVIEPNLDNSDIAYIWPTKQLAEVKGDVGQFKESFAADGRSVRGGAQGVKVDSKATIKAQWSPSGNYNRVTPPTLSRGETVSLYRKRSTSAYLWVVDQTESKLRGREHAVFRYSAKDSLDTDMTEDNSVTIEANNKKGQEFIKITTPGDQGRFKIQAEMNYAKGVMTIGCGDYGLVLNFAEGICDINFTQINNNGKTKLRELTNEGKSDFGGAIEAREITARGVINAEAGCVGCD